MPPLAALRKLLAESLFSYEKWLKTSKWRGKEHDCVNLFVFKFLLTKISPTGPFFDASQIAMEGAIPQLPGDGRKQAVRKDLVIWQRPAMTTWNQEWKAEHHPMAIVEWKTRRKKANRPLISPHDLTWITEYSKEKTDFIGCCATVDFAEQFPRLETVIIEIGNATENFHKSAHPFTN